MRRWLFNLAAAVSLGLCIATLALWLLSYWRYDGFSWEREEQGLPLDNGWFFSVRGEIVGHFEVIRPHWAPERLESVHGFTDASVSDHDRKVLPTMTWPNRFGLAGHFWLNVPLAGRIETTSGGDVVFPYWVPLAASIPLPLLYWWRRRRRRRAGLCPTCGYDVRATPERCPECGAVASVRPVPPVGGSSV